MWLLTQNSFRSLITFTNLHTELGFCELGALPRIFRTLVEAKSEESVGLSLFCLRALCEPYLYLMTCTV
jgi:hypothetical protein